MASPSLPPSPPPPSSSPSPPSSDGEWACAALSAALSAPPPTSAAPPDARIICGGAARRRRIAASAARRAVRGAAPPRPAGQSAAWDAFYARNGASFFKDRHVLRAALPELMPAGVRADPRRHVARLRPGGVVGAPVVVLEVGCGAGNALFPLLRANPSVFAYAFDFSEEAVRLVQGAEEYCGERACAFVGDLRQPESYARVGEVDYVVAVWALSALRPGEVGGAVRGLAGVLKPGGTLLVRDYAEGDMRMEKFARRGAGEALPERLFVRGDGTLAYFFRVDEMAAFATDAGLRVVECATEERVTTNRKSGAVMRRRWLVGRFQRPLADA